jgi:hypothetical protein
VSKITFEKVVQAAGAVVFDAINQHGPDVTYQSMYPQHEGQSTGCFYGSESHRESAPNPLDYYKGEPKGEPACIVGRILHRLGLSEFVEEATDAQAIVRYSIPHNRWSTDSARDRAESFLQELQRHQDSGEAWAKCLAHGIATHLYGV